MKKPIVVNLTGAPGAGKSTGAATIFAELKKLGINAELVTEFAKDKTWEHNMTALNCQEYVFGKQSYRLNRCRDDVDVIVTDSPLPLGLIYNTNPALDYHFEQVVMNVFNTYENINFFINRVKPYNPKGRNQTAEESDQLSLCIKDLYKNLNIGYIEINGDNEGYSKAIQLVLEHLDFIKKEGAIDE
jgi:adenylate kinase family enzyme